MTTQDREDVGRENPFEAARMRVQAKMGWYRHLIYYLVVNLFLMGINAVCNPRDPWFIWPLALWGLALAAHGALAFSRGTRRVEESACAPPEGTPHA